MKLIQQATYREVLEGLLQASGWFKSKGIAKKSDRLDGIISNLSIITEHYENKQTEKLKEIIETAEAYYSMTDAFALVEIYTSFSQLKDHQLPRAKLAHILDGPIVPYEEDPSKSTNAPRNYLFELQIASKFMQKGIIITKFEDVCFDFEDKNYCIECKRLSGHKSIDNTLGKAIEQINKFTLESDNNRGVIALSIEKLYNLDKYFLNTSDLTKMNEETLRFIGRFQQYYGKVWYDVLNMRFVCVLVSVSCVATMAAAGMTSSVNQIVGFDRFPFFKDYISNDKIQLRRLFNILKLE